MNSGFRTPLNNGANVLISLLMSIKRVLTSFGLAYLATGLIAVSLITFSFATNDIGAVEKFISKGESIGLQCQKGQGQPFPNLDDVGDYAYCAPLSDQFSIYYVPGRNAKNEYMAKQESILRDIPGVSSLLRRGKYYLVIVGSSKNFQDTVSLKQLLRPTDLITFDPDGVARSAKTLAIPIYSQSTDLKITWNEISNNSNCSIQTRCVNLSFKNDRQALRNDSCKASLDIAWLTEDTEITRVEKLFLTKKENGFLTENIYAKNAEERYAKVVAYNCQN